MRPILDPCEIRVSCEIRLGAGGSDGRVRRGLAASNRLIRDATAARSLASAFRNSPPACRLRLPGERGMQRYREQLARGVALYPAILPALEPWAEKYAVTAPTAVS